jgi:hypothetical protein
MNTAMRSILLLCVLWLSGCTYVHTTNPISDGNTPVDERLIGTWVLTGFDELHVLNIQKKDKDTNQLTMVSLGDDDCGVFKGRAIQVSNYWVFEIDVDLGTYGCVAPHDSVMGLEIRDEDTLKKLGNRYFHIAYKILEWNDSTSATILNPFGLDDETISEANEEIETFSKLYTLGETSPVLLLSMLPPKLFAQEIKAGKLKGSIKEKDQVTVTDPPEVVRTYLSDLDFYEDMEAFGLFLRVE